MPASVTPRSEPCRIDPDPEGCGDFRARPTQPVKPKIQRLARRKPTRRAAIEPFAEPRQSNAALRRRALELTAANRRLKAEVGQRIAHERSLRHLSQQVLLAQEEERKEISRELHDEVVQTLTGINVQLASLKLKAGAGQPGFSRQIGYTQRLVEKSVNTVHRFARDLRPTVLDDLGLIPALHACLKSFTRRTGARVRFSVFAGIEGMSNDKRTVLYRVAQAALNNIAQHAQATNVRVLIQDLPQAVRMEIKDNGKAFDVAHVLDSRRHRRVGLIGMRERVEMVGGRFRVDSSRGHGTTISAKIPFRRRLAA